MATVEEGPRVRKLKEALDKALREFCATSMSDGVLQSCFPSLYVTHGAYLHARLGEVVSAIKMLTKVRPLPPGTASEPNAARLRPRSWASMACDEGVGGWVEGNGMGLNLGLWMTCKNYDCGCSEPSWLPLSTPPPPNPHPRTTPG